MSESEQREGREPKVPIRKDESELAERLRELIGDEAVNAFARRCGLGESLMRSYLKGAMPSADRVAAIAEVCGVTTDWLITGREPKLRGDVVEAMQGVDKDRLRVAIAAVQEGLQTSRKVVTTDKHAELICAAYDLAQDHGREFIVRIITVAAM